MAPDAASLLSWLKDLTPLFNPGLIPSILIISHLLLLLITVPRALAIKRDATAALVWLLALVLMPFVGVVLFWTTGDPEMRRPLRRVIRGPSFSSTRPSRMRAAEPRFPGLHRMMEREGESPETYGNKARLYLQGPPLFRDMLAEMEKAKYELCVQYYIFRHDRIGQAFVDVMIRKAQQGVKVYFLYDAMGSVSFSPRSLKALRRAGVFCHPFLPLNLVRRRVQINFRNHRKITIVDRRVAYTGGFNMGEEYANMSREEWARLWFDCTARVEGPAVEHLLEEFAADYSFANEDGDEDIPDSPGWLDDHQDPITYEDNTGWIQTISGGPDQETNRIRTLMFWAFARAQKRIWIMTPYFVPDSSIFAVLQMAVDRGVDVRIISQNSTPDHKLAWFAGMYYASFLIEAGAKYYMFRPGMMHSKMFLVDDEVASIGSANVDVRSLSINFELNLLFSLPREVEMVEDVFERTFRHSHLLTPEELRTRSRLHVITENFARLFAPIL